MSHNTSIGHKACLSFITSSGYEFEHREEIEWYMYDTPYVDVQWLKYESLVKIGKYADDGDRARAIAKAVLQKSLSVFPKCIFPSEAHYDDAYEEGIVTLLKGDHPHRHHAKLYPYRTLLEYRTTRVPFFLEAMEAGGGMGAVIATHMYSHPSKIGWKQGEKYTPNSTGGHSMIAWAGATRSALMEPKVIRSILSMYPSHDNKLYEPTPPYSAYWHHTLKTEVVLTVIAAMNIHPVLRMKLPDPNKQGLEATVAYLQTWHDLILSLYPPEEL